MESLKRSIRYQLMESKKLLLGFWITIILVDIAFYIINYMLPHNIRIGFSIWTSVDSAPLTSVVGINLMGILITLIVYNYKSNYETFPLGISLSMTRKDYFLSFLIDNIFVVFICSILQGMLLKIDPTVIKMIDRAPLYDFIYFNTKTDNVFFIIFTLFILFLLFMSFWNLIASINYKFGYKMWLVFIGANILISVFNLDFIPRAVESASKIFDTRLGVFQILIIIVSIIVYYVINYFIVSKTDIKKSIA